MFKTINFSHLKIKSKQYNKGTQFIFYLHRIKIKMIFIKTKVFIKNTKINYKKKSTEDMNGKRTN